MHLLVLTSWGHRWWRGAERERVPSAGLRRGVEREGAPSICAGWAYHPLARPAALLGCPLTHQWPWELHRTRCPRLALPPKLAQPADNRCNRSPAT